MTFQFAAPKPPATTVIVCFTSWNPARRAWVFDHFETICSCGKLAFGTQDYGQARDAAMHRFAHDDAPDAEPDTTNVKLRKRFVR
jgi:hypothetical protein